MNAERFFALADVLPFAPVADIVGSGGLVVVAPHPDDESLGCGGLIASCVDRGTGVHVVIVSDGTGSHPTSRRFPHDALRALREDEARTACRALGLQDDAVSFLRLPDRFVPMTGDAAERASDEIARCVERVDATALAVTWRSDPHCDHQASYALARAVASRRPSLRLVEYPVWGHTLMADFEVGDPPRGARLDISPVLPRKRQAIEAHRSQMTRLIDDDPFGFALPPEMVARFQRPFEIFLEMP